jgi:HK97 family phage major capsid protein
MNPNEIKRLMELLSKAATTHTEAEKSELVTLQAKSNALSTDDAMTAEDVKKTVTSAVKAALVGAPGITEAQVKAIVDTAVKTVNVGEKLDTAALVTQVTEAVTKSLKPGLTAEDVKSAIETAVKGVRTQSKMEFDASGDTSAIDFPISHRSGNLSVAEKQLLNVMQKKSIDDGINETTLTIATKRGFAAEKRLQNRMNAKALTAGGANAGADFVNTTLSSVLLSRLYMESKLAAALIAREITMPTNPYILPLVTTRPVFKSGIAESGIATESSPGTDQNTLTAAKLMGMTQYSDEADEDSLIAILPMVTDQLGLAAADALEDCIINGDTAGSQDNDGAAGDALRLFDGVRKLCLAQAALKVSLASGNISALNLAALRKALGKWGLNPGDLLIVAGVNGYNDIVMLPETLTAEKAGSQATARILTGVAPNIFGMDIVPSSRIREDLNATGVFDNTTVTKGSILILHKPSWIQGVRRGFTLETFRDPRYGSQWVVASFRRAFKPLESLANTRAAVLGINYTA